MVLLMCMLCTTHVAMCMWDLGMCVPSQAETQRDMHSITWHVHGWCVRSIKAGHSWDVSGLCSAIDAPLNKPIRAAGWVRALWFQSKVSIMAGSDGTYGIYVWYLTHSFLCLLPPACDVVRRKTHDGMNRYEEAFIRNLNLFAPDFLHPTGLGQQVWADVAIHVFQSAARQVRCAVASVLPDWCDGCDGAYVTYSSSLVDACNNLDV